MASEHCAIAGWSIAVPHSISPALLQIRAQSPARNRSYPEDLDVAVFATGGLSHYVHGERLGFNNTEWDL